MTVTHFTPAELRFIGARVKADVATRPSIRPYLGEPAPAETCPHGHAALATRSDGRRRCRECDRMRKLRRRREGATR